MYCTKCGVELRDGDRFCARCGHPAVAGYAGGEPMPLLLDKQNKKIAGVCAGFARYFGMDVVLMRVIWLGLALCTGIGFIAYVAAWIVIPSDFGHAPRQISVQAPTTDVFA